LQPRAVVIEDCIIVTNACCNVQCIPSEAHNARRLNPGAPMFKWGTDGFTHSLNTMAFTEQTRDLVGRQRSTCWNVCWKWPSGCARAMVSHLAVHWLGASEQL